MNEIVDTRPVPEHLTAPQRSIADALLEIGAMKFGAFRLKLHGTNPDAPLSPFYIDLRILRSFPGAKAKATDAYIESLKALEFDVLADVPTAATPLVSSISDRLKIPQITPRMDKKNHGTGARIDGVFEEGQVAVLVDDLVTGADSKMEAVDVLRAGGLEVRDVVVLVDREQGGREQLAEAGLKLHSVLGIHDLLKYYAETGKISQKKYQQILDYLSG